MRTCPIPSTDHFLSMLIMVSGAAVNERTIGVQAERAEWGISFERSSTAYRHALRPHIIFKRGGSGGRVVLGGQRPYCSGFGSPPRVVTGGLGEGKGSSCYGDRVPWVAEERRTGTRYWKTSCKKASAAASETAPLLPWPSGPHLAG